VKPANFFIGVTEFFSILLPGAAITFIAYVWLKDIVPEAHVLRVLLGLKDVSGWVAFAVVSYVTGHVVVSLGTHLDPLYDARRANHRNKTLLELTTARLTTFLEEAGPTAATIRELRERPPTWFARSVDWLFLRAAWGGKAPVDSTKPTERPINAYQHARLVLSRGTPAVFAEVERVEADSKFFRSLVVFAVFAAIACIVQLCDDVRVVDQGIWMPSMGIAYLGFVIVGLRIAFRRFCELRLKATEMAFQGMLVLAPPAAQAPPSPTSGLVSAENTRGKETARYVETKPATASISVASVRWSRTTR
jgi:hypothetical protein